MPLNQGLIALVVSVAIPICFATKVLPRGRYSGLEFPVAAGTYEVTVNISYRPDVVPHPRLWLPAIPVQKHFVSSEPSPAKVRRTLLGARQSCDAGYGYCSTAGVCCPDNGDGKCCDDGTCVTDKDTCCPTGGACGTGEDCCLDGCIPEANTCCADGGNCDPGYECCGNGYCKPSGGECCMGGSFCDTGLICVVLEGVIGCCKDLSCTKFQDSASSEDANTVTSTAAANTKTHISSVTPASTTIPSASNPPSTAVSSLSVPNKSSPTAVTNPTQLAPTDSAGVSASNSIASTAKAAGPAFSSTASASKVAANKSLAPARPRSTAFTWAIGLTAAAIMVGAGMVLL